MKILMLPSWYIPEGGFFCKEQASQLIKSGVDVHILANVELPWGKYKFKVLTYPWHSFSSIEDGIVTFRRFSRRIPKSERLNQYNWVNSTILHFEKYIKMYGKPDLIHVHSSMWGGVVAYLIKKKYNIPYVITEHRGRFSEKSQPNMVYFEDWYLPLIEKAFSNADCIIPVSSLQIEKILEFAGSNRSIEVVSNMVDTDFFSPLSHSTESKDFTFFTANSYHDAKGYDILLSAFDLVCKHHENVKLVIAGAGFDNKYFQECLKKCQHSSKIYFAGYFSKEQIRDQLRVSDCFVLASRIEAQSIAVLEALSVGLPIVVTEVVPKEVVASCVGYRVRVNDANGLADSMTRLIENRSLFNRESIVSHVREIASPVVVAKQLIKIYEKVLQG